MMAGHPLREAMSCCDNSQHGTVKKPTQPMGRLLQVALNVVKAYSSHA